MLEVHLRANVDGALDSGKRKRTTTRQCLGQLMCRIVELLARHDTVDETKPVRLCSVDREVGAGAKGAPIGREDDDACLGSRSRGVKSGLKLEQHLAIEGVELVLTIESNRREAVCVLGVDQHVSSWRAGKEPTQRHADHKALRISGAHPPEVALMVLYETLKFVHIVAAVFVLGGGAMLTAFEATAVLGKNSERMLAVTAIGKWVGTRFFAPAWAILLAFGIWTTLEGNLSFGDAWITIGFVVFAVAFMLGPTLHERHARQLSSAIEADGPLSDRALAVGRRELAVSLFELAILIFAVWAMTAKPGL